VTNVEKPGQDEVSRLLFIEANAVRDAILASFEFSVEPILNLLFRPSTERSDHNEQQKEGGWQLPIVDHLIHQVVHGSDVTRRDLIKV
jgi:hypothetical protein